MEDTLWSRGELPPVKSDVLMVWQRGGNSGDMLILDACVRFLRDRGMSVWVSDGSVEHAANTGDRAYLDDLLADYRGMVAFPGGGNVGIYPDNGRVRDAVIRRLRPHHRCLVFPQSAVKPEAGLANRQVTVWCRDSASRSVLDAAGIATALVPDAALYLDDQFPKQPDGEGTFYIRRARGGDTETIEHGIGEGLSSADLTYREPLAEIVQKLSSYRTIVSDRLHGGLIATMMRKRTVLLPVGYHKIRSFYETWLADSGGVAYVERPEDLAAAIAGLRTPDVDYKALFCRHADPALQRFLMGA